MFKDIYIIFITLVVIVYLVIILISKLKCNKKNCKNYSTCSFGKCDCKSGYEGSECEIDNRCKGTNCLNNGTCSGGYCNCNFEYEGNLCQDRKIIMSRFITYNIKAHKPDNNEMYTYYDGFYSMLYINNPSDKATKSQLCFYNLNNNNNETLTYNTPFNLTDNDSIAFGVGGTDMKAGILRKWSINVPWAYYLGKFYISPIYIKENLDINTMLENNREIKKNVLFTEPFLIYIIYTNASCGYFKWSETVQTPIITTTEIPKNIEDLKYYMFTF